MSVILAAARIKENKLAEHSANVTSWKDNILAFEIDKKYKENYVPVISHCHNVPYITSTYWIKEIGPEYIVVMQAAQDTSGRVFSATDFTVVLVSTI